MAPDLAAISDPPDTPSDLAALSFFFPEVTPEEARALDGDTVKIMERRVRVMALIRAGRKVAGIAAELGCSVSTIQRDLSAVLDGYRRVAARSAEEHTAEALGRLAERETDIQTEWDRSKADETQRLTEKTEGRGKDASAQAQVRNKPRYGDPRLAALLLAIWDRRCRLLGLLRGAGLAKNDDLFPIKVVAGFDPVDRV